MLVPLLLAGTLTAQILDDTRGLGARRPAPPPPELEQLQRVADVISIVRREYVDELEEAFLAERCIKGMDAHLGAKQPAPARPVPGAKPLERIGEYWRLAMPADPDARRALGDACLHGMVDDLDRRTAYIGREEYRELLVGGVGLGGIGLEAELRNGVLTVVEPLENTPSERMGLRTGDRLVAVDGRKTAGMKLEEAVRLLRGKVGSTIVLEVERDGEKPLRIDGVREVIRVQSVHSRQLEGGVLYVRIRQFQEATPDHLHKALAAGHAAAGASFRGVVLDLRGNGGGLLYGAIGVAAVFLPETALVSELKGRTEDANKRFFARRQDYERGRGDPDARKLPEALRNAPLVVLVDRRTAAGSEIVAAALQDHKRARLVGEKTFGLGTVQTILPLGGRDALRLTTARFYRPSGGAIDSKPLVPDIEIAHPDRFRGYAAAADPGLPAALRALSSK